ncbi:unnamed protein product [Clonostachys rhizophaga]|uniref:Rho1 guanine nucleotide exchange factor 3 n=1 Tax=Clonostachys rhizophaga TaxID=160324 RepID=A0A9N9YF51_9HYPO|nr:unnamed protein product [Clonostachys rhizophaga]
MSFRGDRQHQYGHVPPVQYPVSGQAQQPQQNDLGRRSSFNSGDDGAYYGGHNYTQRPHATSFASNNSGEDEMFLSNQAAAAAQRASAYQHSSPAMSGYQHQYQDAPPTPQHSYNPQAFNQTSTTMYAPQRHSVSYRQDASPHYSTAPAQTPPTNFAPQTYNPAAYANTASPQRQHAYQGYGAEQGYHHNVSAHGSPALSHGASPGATYTATFPPQPNHTAASFHSTYQSNTPSPAQASGFGTQPSPATYDPSQYANAPYVPQISNGVNYSSAPYPTTPQTTSDSTFSNDQQSYFSGSRSNSQAASTNTTYTYSQSSTSLQRHPTNAPLPSRPVESTRNDWQISEDNYDQDQALLMQDIEAELGAIDSRQRARTNSQQPDGSYSSAPPAVAPPPGPPPGMGSFLLDDDNDSSPGAQSFRQNEIARASSRSSSSPMPPALPEETSHGSDGALGAVVDLSFFGGSFEPGGFSYGDDVGSPPIEASQETARPLPSPGSYNNGTSTTAIERSSSYKSMTPLDGGDTGGLQPPKAQRLSFDEGDEPVSIHSQHSGGTESPPKDDYQDLFYHPGLTNRPLPAVPPTPVSNSSSMVSVNTNPRTQQTQPQFAQQQLTQQQQFPQQPQYAQHGHSNSTGHAGFYQPSTPDQYYSAGATYNVTPPERSISLSGHATNPQVVPPTRSRTDATEERRKLRQQQGLSIQQSGPLPEYESTDAGAFDTITLPSGRKRRFIPGKLSPGDFRRCYEPWALSGIEAWIRELADGEVDLKIKIIEEGLVALFTNKVATMHIADAEALSGRVVADMLKSEVLVPEEEWVKFGPGHISGVLWQMSGTGCYAPKLHDYEITGRCYSYHCSRTLKKVDLDDLGAESTKPTDEWHVFYGLKKEDWESKPKKEVDRQNILHEIVTGEENYIKQLDLFRTLYRDDLRARKPPILHPERQDKFLSAVFGKLDTVVRINKDHLLSQLKYRQQEQGPWIVGFSDLFREWIRKAKSEYIAYATAYPHAQYMVRKEADRNVLFKRFLEEKQKHKSSLKQDWTHFLITPLQRLQRYILLLESTDGKMLVESEEKTNLQKAIREIKTVTLECDAKVEETNKRVEMIELGRILVLRPGLHSILNLDHMGRQLLMQGELTRLGSRALKWVDTQALLFDHFMILAKAVYSRDGKEKKYDVSKEPIHMRLLFLESMNDEPVQRQKGISPLTRAAAAQPAANGTGRPVLEHTPTGGTLASNGSGDGEGKILYPFRVKHLGHEIYTLYASSARDRMEWCNKIIEAKTNYAKALFSQNAEPFHLRVLADAAFHYESTSTFAKTTAVNVKGTPLDKAIEDLEGVLGSAQGIAPVCRAQVNCATGFSAFGKSVIAIGTDYGVFISTPSNPRGWTRTIQVSRVSQIAVLEEFSVCLVIADRSLISYPLDVVAPVSDFAAPVNDNSRRAPQRLAKDVTYFATARMKDRMLVFYKRKEGLHTTFKVVEPIFHKANEKRRLFGRSKTTSGSTESFRDFDEFFFPTECYSLSLFQTYVAVSTSKGIEMLTLDKKQPMSIPDLKAPAIANIASRIQGQKPMGMFRLNENEFILTYEDCAVYVDKHGEVSRTLIMEYSGRQKKAKGATMYGQYLILFNDDYVEVRNAENGRLRQIIAGRDVRVLDYGIRGPTGTNATQAQQTQGRNGALPNVDDVSKGTVKIAMAHPEIPGRQIVLELLLNDGHKEG